MSLVAFALGAAQQYNKLSAEEREKAIKAKEAAAKTKSELDIYRQKKEIDLLYDKDESKYLTADQFRTFKEAEGPTYAKSGYDIFGTPVGDGKFEVSFKKIEKDKADTGKMFPDAKSVQDYIGITKTEWEEGGLGTPEFTIKGKGDEFEVGVKSASKKDKDGKVTGDIITDYQTALNKRDEMLKDAKPGQSVDMTLTDKGIYTFSYTTDPTFSKKEGPLRDAMGIETGLDYYAKASGQFSEDGLKKRAETYSIVPLRNVNLPAMGEGQFQYQFGRDYDIVYNTGIGGSEDAILADHALKFQNHMSPARVKGWASAADLQGGQAKKPLQQFVNAINSFKTVYSKSDKAMGDNRVLRPIEDVYPFLSEYMGIHPSIDKALEGAIRPASSEANSMAVTNEPAYKKTVNGEKQVLLPLNANVAEAFAKPNQEGKLTYPEGFTSVTAKLSQTSGLQQGEIHSLLNQAVGTNGKPDAEATKAMFSRVQQARDTINGVSDKFVKTDKLGRLVFGIPMLGEEEKKTVLSAVNSVNGNANKIKVMRALIPSQNAINRATAEMIDGNSPRGRYTAITGGAEKDFRDLAYQKETANEIMGNISTFKRLMSEGGEVGAPLALEKMRSGANYLLDYAKRTLVVSGDTDGSRTNELLRNLEERLNNISISDERAARAALTNLMGTMLSYQLARLMDPNGRLSDEDRRTVESAMSFSGLFASRDGAIAVLDAMEERADYISARNTALTTGGMQNQIAAQALDVYTDGGNFKKFYDKVFGSYTRPAAPANTALTPPPQPAATQQAPATGTPASDIPTGPATEPEAVFDLNALPST